MASSKPMPPLASHALAVLACLTTAMLSRLLSDWLDHANIVMLFLLAVLLIARYLGRSPAVLAAFLAVALFDFFIVPPQFSFSVSDAQYLVTFGVMLLTALMTGALTAGLRREAEAAIASERRTQALFGMARELAGALAVEQVSDSARAFLRQALGTDGSVLLLDRQETLRPLDPAAPAAEIHVARMALAENKLIECGAIVGDRQASAYIGLRAPTRMRGVLAIVAPAAGREALRRQQALLEAAASLLAIALERLHYAEAAQTAEVDASAERLRASLLAAISHDLRTPLTALRGMAEALAMQPANRDELAGALCEQSVQLSHMVENLLEMARLQAGKVVLHKDWQSLEEIIGSSLKMLESSLAGREVAIRLPDDLPLLEFDAVLIERVFCNLLENAAKYSPAGSPIDIAAAVRGGAVEIAVSDRGCGFAAGQEERAFALFERGQGETKRGGVGLGLAICRAIVEVHGGAIVARNRAGGGAELLFTLPLGAPPCFVDESEESVHV